jgi:hypothetical protein
MKAYMTSAVVVLMLITSMGIFGFLSKAHSDQSLVSGDVQAKLAIYDEKIKVAKENVENDHKILKQMDESVDQTMGRSNDEKGADKAVALRKSQAKERARILDDIASEQKVIAQLNEERAPVAAENRKVEAEVGPIKYIAKFIYGEDGASENMLEKAVTWVIILIVIVFDPLAVIMLLASQMAFQWRKELDAPVVSEPVPEPAPEEVAPVFKDNFEEDEQRLAVELEVVQAMDEMAKVIDTPVEPEPPKYTHAYLDKPFVHFKNLKPMVAPQPIKPEVVEPVDYEAVNALLQEIAHEDEIDTDYGVEVQEEHTPVEVNKHTQNDETETPLPEPVIIEVGEPEPEPPQIVRFGIDVEDRPGDHLGDDRRLLEAAPHPGKKGREVRSPVVADNVEIAINPVNSDFGNTFPDSPLKGDVYLRTDFLPNRLFKYNGQKWIEVDKQQTDVYAYNDQYISHLIKQIEQGTYDPEILTDAEREQIEDYLKGRDAQ